MRVEQSPTGDAGTWSTLHDFGTIAATGTTKVSTYETGDSSDTEIANVSPDARYFRAVVDGVTATGYALSLQAEALVLDPEDDEDMALLDKEVRSWPELGTALARARTLVRGHLGGAKSWEGRLEAVADDPDFYGALRIAVALQVNHIAAETRAKEPSGRVMSREAELILTDYRGSSLAWRGR